MTVSVINTIIELPRDLIDPLRQQANHALMVQFINRDLVKRANLDVTKSIVLYDADGMFEYALPELPNQQAMRELYARTKVRYWSKGVK